MSKSSLLIGKMVRALVDGGWELTGRVTHDKEDRIILSTYEGETLLVFKKKISAMLLLREGASASKPPQSTEVPSEIAQNKNFALFKPAKSEGGAKNTTKYQEGPADDLSEGGVSLPHEVLLSSPTQTKVSTRSDDDDFSISMTSLFGGNKNRISVTSDDDSK
jgi:hypothetical protein